MEYVNMDENKGITLTFREYDTPTKSATHKAVGPMGRVDIAKELLRLDKYKGKPVEEVEAVAEGIAKAYKLLPLEIAKKVREVPEPVVLVPKPKRETREKKELKEVVKEVVSEAKTEPAETEVSKPKRKTE